MLIVFEKALSCLLETQPNEKCAAVFDLQEQFAKQELAFDPTPNIETITVPGRPVMPKLVSPREVSRRNLATEEGRVALIHAIAHIEFNAINLALDAIYRFQDMPKSLSKKLNTSLCYMNVYWNWDARMAI